MTRAQRYRRKYSGGVLGKVLSEEQRCAPIDARHPTTGKWIKVDFQKDARIGSDLDKELVRFPGLVSWYLQLRDQADADLDRARHKEHNVSEDLDMVIRQRHASKGEKLTETQLKTAIRAHPRMRKAFRRRMKAEQTYRALKSAVEALIEKKWSMKTLVDYQRIDHNQDGM